MILTWPPIFDTPMLRIVAVCIDFEVAKSIYVLYVLIRALRIPEVPLTGIWNLDLDLDTVTGLWYTLVPNFVCLH